jgi:GTP pyrophosphokinase
MRLDAKRRVAAEWGEGEGAFFPVDVEVIAAKRAGLLREISEVLSRENIRIAGSRSAEEDASVRLRYTIEVGNLGQLARALTLIREVRGVARAARR